MDKPKGLFIPLLYESTMQTIKWTPVENASTYKVEASIDGNFSSDAVLVYEGSGMLAAGIDSGYIWEEIDKQSKTWQEYETDNLSWDTFEKWSTVGISWNGVDGRTLSWVELEEKELTWNDFDTLHADDGEMLSCTVIVPTGKQSMRFRVSAFDGTTWSDTLVSERKPILSIHKKIFDARQNELLTMQIDGCFVQRLLGANFKIYYDETRLTFEDVKVRNANIKVQPYINRRVPGQIKFLYKEEMIESAAWDGLIIDVEFTSQKNGKALVVLERSNEAETRII